MDRGLLLIKLSWGNKGELGQAYLIDNLKMELQADGVWLSKLNCLIYVGKSYYVETRATQNSF